MSGVASYLTVAKWPREWDALQRMTALVESVGLDPTDAERRVKAGPPLVVAKMPGVAAESALGVLRARGVESLAVSTDELLAAGTPLRAKRLVALGGAGGRYNVELWRGQPFELEMSDVRVVVRAQLRKVVLGEIRADAQVTADEHGNYQIESGSTRERSLRVREIIEVHRRGGERVRIDSSKFSFDVLGGGRGTVDLASADRLALRLATEATGAVVDTGFANFGGGALISARDVPRSALDRQRFPDDDPAFEFYSVWVGKRYRSG
jgi:hypothetical protein